jgi:PIN domain nuclease of toxin-antitoxin system
LKTSFDEFLDEIKLNSFQIIPVLPVDALTISTLPFYHRDPFDRMIVAQAKNNQCRILSKDDIFVKYNCDLLW